MVISEQHNVYSGYYKLSNLKIVTAIKRKRTLTVGKYVEW